MWRYIALLSAVLLFSSPASAWVKYFQPLPEGEAVVIRDIFCRAEHCPGTQGRWRALIQSAADAWNAAGSRFHFAVQPARPFENFCEQYGLVVVAVADPGRLCPEDGHFIRSPGIVGRTAYRHKGAVVYLKNGSDTPDSWDIYTRILLHEFGHVVGLGHPNESGQSVSAIMNTPVRLASLQDDDIAGARALYGLAAAQTSSQAALEAPDEGQTLTGNNLGAGEHTLDLFINSRLHTTRTVTVITYGQGFLRGLEKTWTITDWPSPGTDTVIAWNQATQNIEIVDIQKTEPPTDSTLDALLGTWSFQNSSGVTHRWTMTDIDPDPYDHHAFGVVGQHRIYGEENTTRWYSQPLKQFEVYWTDAARCHLYAFDLTSPTTATGYYWYGFGTEWEECFRDNHGPYTATGQRQ